jgi:hypothetical protein
VNTNAKKTIDHTMSSINNKLKLYCKSKSNKLHFLNNSIIKIPIGKKTYTILGTTLWSNIPAEKRSQIQDVMSDYKYIYVQDEKTKKIRNINADETTALHITNVKYIKKQILKAEKDKNKLILLVHHRPYTDSSYSADGFDPAYSSNLNHLIVSPIIFVGFGHTHVATNALLNGVKIYSNPKGYPSEKTGYDKTAKVIIK